MVDIREYADIAEVSKLVGVEAKEIVDALSIGETGLVYNRDYRWAENEPEYHYVLIMHIETCVNALKHYFKKC